MYDLHVQTIQSTLYIYMYISKRDTFSKHNFDQTITLNELLVILHFVQELNDIWYLQCKLINNISQVSH